MYGIIYNVGHYVRFGYADQASIPVTKLAITRRHISGPSPSMSRRILSLSSSKVHGLVPGSIEVCIGIKVYDFFSILFTNELRGIANSSVIAVEGTSLQDWSEHCQTPLSG